MEIIFLKRINELKKNKKELTQKLNIKIKIKGKKVIFEGSPLDEYEASLVLEAIKFGFSAKKAIKIKDGEYIFRVINIRDYTRKKNLKETIGRIIGKKGKTRRTIEQISNSNIIIKDNEIGIIDDAETIEETLTAITNLIRGTKQSNVYRYLEKQKTKRKNLSKDKKYYNNI